MPLTEAKIDEIMKKHKKDFDELEYYDNTRERLWGRKRIDLTLDKKTIIRLKKLKEKTGKSISRLVEEAVRSI